MSDDTYTLDPQQGRNKSGRFHCTSDGHNKWWRFLYDTETGVLITEWGPLDSSAVQDNKKVSQSAKDVEKIVTSKLRKGYYPADGEGRLMTWDDVLDETAEEDYVIEDLVDWLSQQTDSPFALGLVEWYDEKGFLTPKQLEAARKKREQATDPITQEGFYLNPDGDTVKVRRAKAGHFYAVNLDGELIHGGMKGLTGSMLTNNP